MQLSDYLKREKMTLRVFAGLIGRTEASVSRLARGLQRPDWTTIEAIERATGGAVTRNDFGDPPRPIDGGGGTAARAAVLPVATGDGSPDLAPGEAAE